MIRVNLWGREWLINVEEDYRVEDHWKHESRDGRDFWFFKQSIELRTPGSIFRLGFMVFRPAHTNELMFYLGTPPHPQQFDRMWNHDEYLSILHSINNVHEEHIPAALAVIGRVVEQYNWGSMASTFVSRAEAWRNCYRAEEPTYIYGGNGDFPIFSIG